MQEDDELAEREHADKLKHRQRDTDRLTNRQAGRQIDQTRTQTGHVASKFCPFLWHGVSIAKNALLYTDCCFDFV